MEATITLDGSTIVSFLLAFLAAGVTILVLYAHMSRSMKERFDAMSNDTKERFDAMSNDTKERFDAMSNDTKERFDAMSNDTKERFDAMSNDTKERFDAMSKDTKERFDKVDSRLDKLTSRVEEVNSTLSGRIDKLFSKVTFGSPSAPSSASSPMAKSESPLVLTSFGDEVAEEVNALDIVKRHADKVQLPEDASRLDIQDACFKFAFGDLMDVMEPQEKLRVKDAIYQNSSGDPFEVLRLLGILLRDYHLKDRGFEVPVRKTDEGQTPSSPQTSA